MREEAEEEEAWPGKKKQATNTNRKNYGKSSQTHILWETGKNLVGFQEVKFPFPPSPLQLINLLIKNNFLSNPYWEFPVYTAVTLWSSKLPGLKYMTLTHTLSPAYSSYTVNRKLPVHQGTGTRSTQKLYFSTSTSCTLLQAQNGIKSNNMSWICMPTGVCQHSLKLSWKITTLF